MGSNEREQTVAAIREGSIKTAAKVEGVWVERGVGVGGVGGVDRGQLIQHLDP